MRNFFILFCLCILFYSGVSALGASQKGDILENFKKKQYDLLFENDISDIASSDKEVFNISNRVNLFNSISDNIKGKRQEYEQKNNETMQNIISLEDQLNQIDLDIQETTNNISKTNSQIIQINTDLENTKNTINILRKKIEDSREILLKYLVYIYKKGNTVYSNDQFDNIKSILLNGDNIGDLINDLYFKGIIEVSGKKLIDKHREFVSQLYVKNMDLESKENELKQLRKSLIVGRSLLQDKRELKDRILTVSKGKQLLYQQYINEKIKLESEMKLKAFKEEIKFNVAKESLLAKYGCKFVDLTQNSIESRTLNEKCLSLNRLLYAEGKLRGFTKSAPNILDWPVLPSYGISTFYRDKGYTASFGSEHDAIDIVEPQGTPIRAPADGYVMYVALPTSPDYSYIALKHSDGYITVYGHLSEVMVKQYDYLKSGDVFAKTGGEYGTLGAGYMTTGPHLHFEVFKDKKNLDPFDVLSLASLNFSSLPEKYRFKFYSDFKDEKGYAYNNQDDKRLVFKLEGSSEIERQKSLISKYAVGSFNDWKMWVDESLDGNIDPTFVMCIGLAETSLGKNLKTPYNVGNVGNTDSGAVKAYPNARSGIYWIVRTLNNKILGGYNAVSDLSRYGNKNGSIYASSSANWHNNIIKCMSNIKGRYVPDNYNFRIIK